jgi:hypothetical protein
MDPDRAMGCAPMRFVIAGVGLAVLVGPPGADAAVCAIPDQAAAQRGSACAKRKPDVRSAPGRI